MMCRHHSFTFSCGCWEDWPDPGQGCDNRGNCTREFVHHEKIDDLCPEHSQPFANEDLSQFDIDGIELSDANVSASVGSAPEQHVGDNSTQPETIDPSLLPSPPHHFLDSLTERLRAQTAQDNIFNIQDNGVTDIPPGFTSAFPEGAFQDANGIWFHEEPRMFLSSNYGCPPFDPDLPSVGETPLFEGLDSGLVLNGVTDLDFDQSMFPSIFDPSFDFPLGTASADTALVPTTEEQSTSTPNTEHLLEQSSLVLQPERLIVNHTADAGHLLAPPNGLPQDQSGLHSINSSVTTPSIAQSQARTSNENSPITSQSQGAQTSAAYPPTPLADLECTEEQDEPQPRATSRQESPADELMTDAPGIPVSRAQSPQSVSDSQVVTPSQPQQLHPTPASDQSIDEVTAEQTPVEELEEEPVYTPAASEETSNANTPQPIRRRKRKSAFRLTQKKYAKSKGVKRRAPVSEEPEDPKGPTTRAAAKKRA